MRRTRGLWLVRGRANRARPAAHRRRALVLERLEERRLLTVHPLAPALAEVSPAGVPDAVAAPSPAPWITDGLLAYWSFDEAQGAVVSDLSGNGFDATLGGDAAITPAGLEGGALDLRTGNDWATVLDPGGVTSFSDGSTDHSFTAAMWVDNANNGYGTSRYLQSGVWGSASNWGLGIGGTFGLVDQDAAMPPLHPIAYWNFDDNVDDQSGNGHVGTLHGATYGADVPAVLGTGKSLSFDGVDDYVDALLNVSETSYTASFWFKADAASRGLFEVEDGALGANGWDRDVCLSGTDVAARTWSNEVVATSGQNYVDGQWHHVAHVVGSEIGGQRLYVDGQLVAAGTKASSDFNWQTRIAIGFSKDAASPYFQGSIDDVAVWNGALTEEQVQALAGGASPAAVDWPSTHPPQPLAYYNFDGNADDQTGNGHAGRLHGATYSANVPSALGGGKSLSFDGVDDYVDALLNVSETDYTTSLWFKATAGDRGLFAVMDDGPLGANGNDRHICLSGTNVGAYTWNGEWIASDGKDYVDGQWHHVAHVVGSEIGGQRLYVDGQLVASGTKASSDFNWQTRIVIGYSNAASRPYLDGFIDDVSVWDSVLTEDQIQALAAGASPLALNLDGPHGTSASGPGVWTHVAGVFDAAAGKARLYQNGQLVGEATLPVGFDLREDPDPNVDLTFGARTWGQSLIDDDYRGLIDDAYLFNRALSEAEIEILAARAGPWMTPGQVFSVLEGTSVGQVVGTPEHGNPDGGPIQFVILSGNTGGAFAIDPATGQITVAGPLDRETTASYPLLVRVTEETNNPAYGATEIVTIHVDDVDEPIYIDEPQAFTVSDEAPDGTVIWRIERRDLDNGFHPLTWTIDSGNTAGAFAIDPLGNLVVNNAAVVDRTVQDRYVLGVTVDDGVHPTASTTITVYVEAERRLFFDEETLRPFANTISVAGFGAIPNDALDDTAAIQAALDELAASSLDYNDPVRSLYFPEGEYLVSSTLVLPGRVHRESLGVTIFGADPATTILRWTGPSGGTMFNYGAWYGELARLTLDGAGIAGTGLFVGFNFTTYQRISDMVFKDFQNYGVTTPGDPGQAEIVVARCRFLRNGQAGAKISGWNDLDWWFWQNEFVDNTVGIYVAAGAAHAYENIFRGSTWADMRYSNMGVFAVRDNVSIGSNCFVELPYSHSWPLTMTIQGNTIVDLKSPYAMWLNALGGYLLIDNVIQSPAGQTVPPICVRNSDPWNNGPANAYIIAAGNTFTVANPYSFWDPGGPSPITDLGHTVVEHYEVVMPYPHLPEVDFTPDGAQVFEIAPGAGAAEIQAAIDQAVAQYNGQRPIVHLQSGSYYLNQTVVIPPRTDLRLIGDQGENSVRLYYGGSDPDGAALKILGPTQATVERLGLSGGSSQSAQSKVGLVIEDVDQPGASIHFDQLTGAGYDHTFASEGLVNAQVTLFNLSSNGDRVIGPGLPNGELPNSVVDVFAGASSRFPDQSNPDVPFYDIDQGGRFYIRDTWYEGSCEKLLHLTGSGEFYLGGGTIAVYQRPSVTPLVVDHFDGKVGLVNVNFVQGPTTVTPGATTDALVFGNTICGLPGQMEDPSLWNIATSPGQVATFGNTFWGPIPTVNLPSGGLVDDAAFLLEMLEPLRRTPPNVPRADLAHNPDTTNLRLLRVSAEGRDGVVIRRAPPTVDIVDVTPDPRTTAVDKITIAFSEAVAGFDLGDLALTRDGGTNLLPGSGATLTSADNVTWELGNLSGLTRKAGAYVLTLSAAGSGITDLGDTPLAGDAGDAWETDSTIAGRRIFYSNSKLDGNDPAANAADDAAIDPAKEALLPGGGKAAFKNYTSFSRGLNGIMVDVAGLPVSTLTAADFTFRYGNDDTPGDWLPATDPTTVAVRVGAGAGGSDRVTLIWADHAIPNGNWLQVTVLANSHTGLATDDVFYFGSAIGETGNSTADAKVNSSDVTRIRNNYSGFGTVGIESVYDFNRDRKVNSSDVTICRNYYSGFTPLRLISPPAAMPSPTGAPAITSKTAQAYDAVLRQGADLWEPAALYELAWDWQVQQPRAKEGRVAEGPGRPLVIGEIDILPIGG